MRKPSRCMVYTLLMMLVAGSSGCEMGHSWFTMSSDSPTPWFGFDLLPRRKTTDLTPPRAGDGLPGRERSAKPSLYQASDRSGNERSFSKELHLPPVSAFFNADDAEEVSFTGPKSAFSR